MKTEPQRTCPSCGNEFSEAMEFCPVCMLRGALPGAADSAGSSFEETVRPTADQPAQRFEHYELVTGKDGQPVELGAQTAISTPGAFDGTPEFASSEQIAEAGGDIRSDLYSLGVTLWEGLSGQTPFQGSPAGVMYQHRQGPSLDEQLKGVSQPFGVLIDVLLEKDSGRRFQSPAELLKVMPTVRDAVNAGFPS